jgi:hypothetical protein
MQSNKWKTNKDKRAERRANDPKVLRRRAHHEAVEFAEKAEERAAQLATVAATK